MRKFIIPTKDTTIYQAFPTINAGLDEILEVGKLVDANTTEPTYVSASVRTLLYFNLPTTESVPATANYFLNLKLANASKLVRGQTIMIYQISRSWDEGTGYFYQDIKNANDGATWRQFNSYTSWSRQGGDILTGSLSASVSLSDYPIKDIRVDITNIIQPFVSKSLQNTFYGLVIQFPVSDETASLNEGNVKFFSTQTHTVHQPTLEVAWDSQSYVTGSLIKAPSINVKVSPTNLQEYYVKNDVTRIDLSVRDEYPLKSFNSTLRYKNKYYLPSSSYYSVVDTGANTTIIPFDAYSKVNCDPSGMYIDLDTSGLYSGRFYTIKLKVQSGSYTRTINTQTLFRII